MTAHAPDNSNTPSRPEPPGGGSNGPVRKPSTITAGELALVCARYDIGEIHKVTRLRRGSGSAPKVVLETNLGAYMLKRQAPARADPRRVAFSHDVQLFLRREGFPAPQLVGTRSTNNSMLQIRGQTYELFHFVDGRHDSKSPEDARQAGRTLARLHTTLRAYVPPPSWVPQAGTYHDSAHLAVTMDRICKRFSDPDRREVTSTLAALYQGAADLARNTSTQWHAASLIHGDWHPGNMLFARTGPSEVVCVLDFESARPAPRIIDVANGALQFSMARLPVAPDDAAHSGIKTKSKQTRSELDLDRYRFFLSGYDDVIGERLTQGETASIPWLMIEALVAETAVPIALTGRFGKLDPMGVLRLVRRKARWIAEQAHTRLRVGD